MLGDWLEAATASTVWTAIHAETLSTIIPDPESSSPDGQDRIEYTLRVPDDDTNAFVEIDAQYLAGQLQVCYLKIGVILNSSNTFYRLM